MLTTSGHSQVTFGLAYIASNAINKHQMANDFSICLFYDLYRVIAIDIEEILSCDPESGDADNCYLYSYAYRQKHFEYLKSFLQFITTLQFYKFLYDFKVKYNLYEFVRTSVCDIPQFGKKMRILNIFQF